MSKIIVSSCLLGEKVRYDGSHNLCSSKILEKWKQEDRIISLCPEILAGLPTPRPPAEITNGNGNDVLDGKAKVVEINGNDVTDKFIEGAQKALAIAKEHNVKLAILKERSPSCGGRFQYDGSFSNTVIPGSGVTAALFRRNNITVFSEENIEELPDHLR